MRMTADLAFAEPRQEAKPHRPRAPRIASEKSDIEHLLGALRQLCAECVVLLGSPGARGASPLRRAVYAARTAEYRVVVNKSLRERRKGR